jgi:hypothetical protein
VIIAITARGEDGSERGGLLENDWEIKIQFHVVPGHDDIWC